MWTEAQLDWMKHLVRINVDRVLKPEGLNAHDVKRLKWEIGAERIVLSRIAKEKPLTGVLIHVARYMAVYANQHIDWYARRIDQKTCGEAIQAAKAQMWEAVRSEARSYVQTGQRK